MNYFLRLARKEPMSVVGDLPKIGLVSLFPLPFPLADFSALKSPGVYFCLTFISLSIPTSLIIPSSVISFKYYLTVKVKVKSLSRVRLFVTPWTVALQVPLPTGFSRQDCWTGLPFPCRQLLN